MVTWASGLGPDFSSAYVPLEPEFIVLLLAQTSQLTSERPLAEVGQGPMNTACCGLYWPSYSKHIKALPSGMGVGEQASPYCFLQVGENLMGRVYCLQGCALDLPHQPSSCVRLLADWPPSGEALTGPQSAL